ncbi:MAG: RsmD family RNA methyltransferase [Thermoprotei archaeon]|nr:RsmD family RNA methyltransferase [Thermoprotei archaeon]
MKSYYAILSGENLSLALEELRAILEAELPESTLDLVLEGVALISSSPEAPRVILGRSSLVKEVGEVLGVAERGSLEELLNSLPHVLGGENVKVEVRRFKSYGEEIREDVVVKTLYSKGVKCSLEASTRLKLIASEGLVIAGISRGKLEFRELLSRKPSKRPYFKPGSLTPQLSRLLVNLSRLKRGSTFLDPFCGAGGLAIEACLMGAGTVICQDIDREASRGSHKNLSAYGCGGVALTVRGDATRTPIASGVVDAIATDPPYGRLTSTGGRDYSEIVLGFLGEAARVARRGSYIVYAGPHHYSPWRLALEAGLEVVGRHHMFVHGSLTREIVVARV